MTEDMGYPAVMSRGLTLFFCTFLPLPCKEARFHCAPKLVCHLDMPSRLLAAVVATAPCWLRSAALSTQSVPQQLMPELFRFRSVVASNAEIQNLAGEVRSLDAAVAGADSLLQLITEAWDKTLTLRRSLTAYHVAAERLLGELIIARRVFRDGQREALQRLQQLHYRLRLRKAQEALLESEMPVVDFAYRWMVVQTVVRPKVEERPRWEVLERPGPLAGGGPEYRRKVDTIRQSNPTYKATGESPENLLIVRGRHFPEGYIVSTIMFPDNAEGAAGFIFKFQNEHEFGYVTLALTPPHEGSSRTGVLSLGHVNRGVVNQFSPVQISLPSDDPSILFGVNFDNRDVRVYVNTVPVSMKEFDDIWADDGSFGIHVAAGTTGFRGVAAGRLGTELSPEVTKALGGHALRETSLITRALSHDEVQALLLQKREQSVTIAAPGTTPPPGPGVGRPICFDYRRIVPNLEDWEDAARLGWAVIRDMYDQSYRLATTQTLHPSSTQRALILKDMACDAATISTRFVFQARSQAGIALRNKDADNRLIAAVDSGFGIVQLQYWVMGSPRTLAVSAAPTAKEGQLHSMTVTEDRSSGRVEVTFNGQRVIDYNTKETLKTTGFGYGLWVGRGAAEFRDFTITNVRELPAPATPTPTPR